jgi:cytochrome P450
MRFAEEVLLLLLNEDTGYFAPIPEWRMSCALAGSVLMDLALENRIDSDLESLTLIDATPTGDENLDPVLEEIAADPDPHSPQFWVERIARRAEQISDTAFDRLVGAGILDFDTGGFWSLSRNVSRTGRYPLVDGTPGEEVKSRITRILLSDEIPDPHDIAIIGLLNTCGGVQMLLEADEYEGAQERIELLSGMDLIGRTISDAVRSSYRPPDTVSAVIRRPIPTVGLFDMLGSRSFRSGNLPKFLAEQSERYGPVYQLKAGGKSLVVLASAELNHWTGRKGRMLLRTRDYLEAFLTQWGTARSIASMDGADHFRMRKAMRAGIAPAVVQDRLDEVFALARKSFGQWKTKTGVHGERACQHLIGEQIAHLTMSVAPMDILDELLAFEYRALLVHVFGILPKFTMRTPRMKRYLAHILDLYTQIHATHTPAQRQGKRRDLADDLMDLHQADPQFLPETDLGFSFIAAVISGHYTSSAMAFAIYELLANPDLRERIEAEADALFANRDPVAADLTPEAIDVTHRFMMESQRLHPVIPVHRRTAMNAFEIDGLEIAPRSDVLIAFTAPHYLDKHFKDPERFDIDRYLPPRDEHKQRGAYAPFGTGTHICSGRRWTELQMVANLLVMVRHLELEMVPSNYRLKINPLPKLSPNKRFKFRIKGYRHPIQ